MNGSSPHTGSLTVKASIFEAGSVTANTSGGPKGQGDLVTITNAVATNVQRASVFLDSFTVVGSGFSVTGMTAGSTNTGVATASATSFSGTVQFDATGKLNGRHKGTLSAWVENNQTLLGAAHRDLNGGNAYVWNLAQTVSGNQGNQSSTFDAGLDFSAETTKVNAKSNQGRGSTATFLDGTLGAQRTISTHWRNPVSGEGPGGTDLVSDVLDLTGTGNDMFVLQINYDESALILDEAAMIAQELLMLGWLDGNNQWVNAVAGNSSVDQMYAGDVAYDPALHLSLGTWGVDSANNVAWAVLDHNSEFSVITIIPEPASFGLAVLGGLTMMGVRRRR